MNTTPTSTNNWTETKSKIKAKFGKLTDANIDLLNGNLEPLSGQLQSTYGYAKEQADKESASFKSSLTEDLTKEKKPTTELKS